MQTSQMIFDKAALRVERDGADALSMRQLANEINVTPMALYRHYASRDALLDAIANRYFSELGVRWKAYAAGNDYKKTLLFIGDDLVRFYLKHPHIYQLMFIKPRAQARIVSDPASGDESPTLSVVISAVQKGIAVNQLAGGSTQEIALALAGQLHGLAALHQGGRIRMADSQFRTFCQQAFTRAISAYKVIT
ncbi:MAG TPA: TetR/AcrR family transcriptional regulator [Candidatus Saccharimonadales bacterium]|nr:TetR/AcrR family transcriptional regulator [Candidatus Saccharimonadales bacterium]